MRGGNGRGLSCDRTRVRDGANLRPRYAFAAGASWRAAQWLEARTLTGADRRATGAQAIEKVDRAIRHIHEIDSALKGTWGAYDLERSHMLWLEGLRRRLDE